MSDTISAYNDSTATTSGATAGPPSASAVDTWHQVLAEQGWTPGGSGDNGWGSLGGSSPGWDGPSAAAPALATPPQGSTPQPVPGTMGEATGLPGLDNMAPDGAPLAPAADDPSASGDGPGRPGRKKDDGGPSLPDPPAPPGSPPPSGVAPATGAPSCHGFEAAGRAGGAVLGGVGEGLRQAGPGALKGAAQGAAVGAGTGALYGAGTGALAGGAGAVPGAAAGATVGAFRGSVVGAVAGGTPGFAKGVQEGAGPGAAAGAGLGRRLDDTRFGRWVQGCPAPEADTSTKGPPVMESQGGDPGLTRPTGEIGGKPGGQPSTGRKRLPGDDRADPAEKAQVDSENQVAGATAGAGYRTIQNPTRGPNPALTRERMTAEGLDPKKNPDLLLEDRIWDTYTPESDAADSVRNGIQRKIDDRQTHRVVVDLRGTTQTEASVRAAIRANPLRGVKEVMFLTLDGLSRPFRP